MFMTPEPFLSAEIAYRQQRVRDSFNRKPRRQKVPRRRPLRLPGRRPSLVATP